MKTIRLRRIARGRAGSLALALALAVACGACGNLLDVSNPGAITVGNLNNPSMESAIVNGALGAFQTAFSRTAFYGGIFVDELIDRHTYQSDKPIDVRQIDPSNDNIDVFVYQATQRSRGAADNGLTQLQPILGGGASSSLDVARLHDLGGYSLILLAETFCGAPIDMSATKSPDDLLKLAVTHFNTAISVAAAARAAGRSAAAADSLTNLANLGIARASLDLNDKTTALAKAQLVPANFQWWANYSANASAQYNFIGDQLRIGDEYAGYDPSLLGLNDPRIPQAAAPMPVPFNTSALIWLPFQGLQYSGFQPGQLVRIDRPTGILVGSGLEAQYIAAEAQGPTAATLAFVNARRAVGNQPPVTYTGDQLMAELRQQKKIDFFLSAHRLGDLRRYKRFSSVDNFPSGLWPGDNQTVYGTQVCMPLPNSEINGNQNATQPPNQP